jgi:hypothetical protein
MKKLIVMMVLGVSITSCVETKEVPKCQSTEVVSVEDPNKEWFELMDRNDGVQYYWFKDKYYTETQLDSINEVLHIKITEEMIRELDSISQLSQ